MRLSRPSFAARYATDAIDTSRTRSPIDLHLRVNLWIVLAVQGDNQESVQVWLERPGIPTVQRAQKSAHDSVKGEVAAEKSPPGLVHRHPEMDG